MRAADRNQLAGPFHVCFDVRFPHVRDHGRIPPVFFPSQLQDQSVVPVFAGVRRRIGGPKGTPMVGGPPQASSQIFRPYG